MPTKYRWNSLSRTTRSLLGLLVLVILLEFCFDLFEKIIGQVMLWTNDKRPKVGRL